MDILTLLKQSNRRLSSKTKELEEGPIAIKKRKIEADPETVPKSAIPTSQNKSMIPNSAEEMKQCYDISRGMLLRKIGSSNFKTWKNLTPFYINSPIVCEVGPQTIIDSYRPSTIHLNSFHNSQRVLFGSSIGEHRVVDYSDFLSYAVHHNINELETDDEITSLDVSPDDQSYLVNGEFGVKIYDSNKDVKTLNLEGSSYSKSAKFNPYNQSTILVGSVNGNLSIHDTRIKESTTIVLSKKVTKLPINDIEFINSNQFISSSKSTSKITIWDIRYNTRDTASSVSSTILNYNKIKDRGITSVKFDQASNFIYTLSLDNTLKIFSLPSVADTDPLLDIKLNNDVSMNSKLKIMGNSNGGNRLIFNSINNVHCLNIPTSLNGLNFLKHQLNEGKVENISTVEKGLTGGCSITDFDYNSKGNFMVVGGTTGTAQEMCILNIKR